MLNGSDKRFLANFALIIITLVLVLGALFFSSARAQEEVNTLQYSYGQYSQADGIGRFVMFDGFSQEAAFEFNKFTNFLIGEEAKTLEIQLSNGGGSLFPALSMIDNVRLLKANGVRVITRVTGMCASACALLFSYGDERQIGRSSWLMFHALSSSYNGMQNLHDLHDRVQFLEALQLRINAQLAEALGKPLPEIIALMESDSWIDAHDAVALGYATSLF